MSFFALNIFTPEYSKIIDNVVSISASSPLGCFTVLALHEPFLFRILPGKIKLILEEGKVLFMEVPESTLIIDSSTYVMNSYFCKEII